MENKQYEPVNGNNYPQEEYNYNYNYNDGDFRRTQYQMNYRRPQEFSPRNQQYQNNYALRMPRQNYYYSTPYGTDLHVNYNNGNTSKRFVPVVTREDLTGLKRTRPRSYYSRPNPNQMPYSQNDYCYRAGVRNPQRWNIDPNYLNTLRYNDPVPRNPPRQYRYDYPQPTYNIPNTTTNYQQRNLSATKNMRYGYEEEKKKEIPVRDVNYNKVPEVQTQSVQKLPEDYKNIEEYGKDYFKYVNLYGSNIPKNGINFYKSQIFNNAKPYLVNLFDDYGINP